MSRIEAFIPTRVLFTFLSELAVEYKAKFVFHRFESELYSAGLTVFDPSAGLENEYLGGGYQLIYLSLGSLPKHAQDWNFLEKESVNLIELAGARDLGEDIEWVVIRPMAKKSKAQKLFKKIQECISHICQQGVELNGIAYPKVFYALDLISAPKRMWVDLETKTISAKIKLPTDVLK